MVRRWPHQAVLRELVGSADPARLEAGMAGVADHDLLVDRAIFHGLQLIARSSALRDLLDPDARAHLESVCRHDLITTSQILEDVGNVADALGDLPWAVVKGPVLDELVYPSPGKRAYGDLDVLVRSTDLGDAVGALEERGATLIDRNLAMARTQGRGELAMRLPLGSVLDLHWHLVNDPRTRRVVPLQTGDLLARRVPANLGGATAWRLDRPDALVHLAVHALLAGGQRLIWVRDLAESANDTELDVQEFARRAQPLQPMVDLMLARARRLTDLRQIQGRVRRDAVSLAMRGVSGALPMGRHPSERPTGGAPLSAVRPGAYATINAFGRGLWEERVRRRHGAPSKNQLTAAADSAQDRRSFYAYVRNQD